MQKRAGTVCRGLLGIVLLGAAGAASIGCSSGGKAGGSAACQAACSSCASELCADCAATSARFRDDFENAVYACVRQGSDAACDTLWIGCMAQAEGQITVRPIDTTYGDACFAKKSECDATTTTFADDDCLLSRILEANLVAQAMQCLSLSCAEISACFGPLFN
jgi:hypothetical protein